MKWRFPSVVSVIALLFASAISHAEIVTESWMRQAGISCGGGMSVSAQGELDAAVLRRLKVASIDGSGNFQMAKAESLLNQFKEEEKKESYTNYINCLITLMNMASNTSGLPPKEVVLNSPIAVASLETIQRGQRFVMSPGDTIAVKDHSLIFTLNKINKTIVYFTWSNSESGKGNTTAINQAQLINLGEACSLVPYKVEAEKDTASFLSNC